METLKFTPSLKLTGGMSTLLAPVRVMMKARGWQKLWPMLMKNRFLFFKRCFSVIFLKSNEKLFTFFPTYFYFYVKKACSFYNFHQCNALFICKVSNTSKTMVFKIVSVCVTVSHNIDLV